MSSLDDGLSKRLVPERNTGIFSDLLDLSRGSWDERHDAAARVARRIEAIEARQRDHQMHDPDCLLRRTQKNMPDMYLDPSQCTCWLSEEPT